MKVTTKMIKEWCNLYTNQNVSTTRIAKLYNVADSTIWHYLNLSGVKIKRPKHYYTGDRIFKNKYNICVYDFNYNLCWVFNNRREMAQTLNRSISSVKGILRPDRIHKKFWHQGKWYLIRLVEVAEDSI